jgi:hypothetical protein
VYALLEDVELQISAIPIPGVAPGPAKLEGIPRGPLDRLARVGARQLSRNQVRALLRSSLGELHLALCLHRVSHGGALGAFTIEADALDELIELLCATRPTATCRWLTVSFDDGYHDAACYVASRARIFPDVEWLVFVCPERHERREKYSWDPPWGPCELASIASLRELARAPNVELGNHTNTHVRQSGLSPADVEREYADAFADFARLFGPQRHFAFPFGTPGFDFGTRHVEVLRRMTDGLIWSTERRPYRACERQAAAVLPRVSVDGTWSVDENAVRLALLAAKYRALGSPHRF